MGKLLSWAVALGPGGCVFTHTHTNTHHWLLPQDRSRPETAAWLFFFFPFSKLVLSQTLPIEELESAVRTGSLPTASLRAKRLWSCPHPPLVPPQREALGQGEPAQTKWRVLRALQPQVTS